MAQNAAKSGNTEVGSGISSIRGKSGSGQLGVAAALLSLVRKFPINSLKSLGGAAALRSIL